MSLFNIQLQFVTECEEWGVPNLQFTFSPFFLATFHADDRYRYRMSPCIVFLPAQAGSVYDGHGFFYNKALTLTLGQMCFEQTRRSDAVLEQRK